MACTRAKINLCLHIFGKRADGLHELKSLISFANFGDLLILWPEAPLGLTIDGPFAADVPQCDNLVIKAARLYADFVLGGREVGHFHLVKRLPVASGIGGGSADAALALRLLDSAHGHQSCGDQDKADRMYNLACNIGSDVPACFMGNTCWMRGRGFDLTPVDREISLWVLLVNSGQVISTADMFSALSAKPLEGGYVDDISQEIGDYEYNLIPFLRALRNDLEPVVTGLFPEIGHCLSAVQATEGCLVARMSGSGATVFGVYESWGSACRAGLFLRAKNPKWWIRPVLLGGNMPTF